MLQRHYINNILNNINININIILRKIILIRIWIIFGIFGIFDSIASYRLMPTSITIKPTTTITTVVKCDKTALHECDHDNYISDDFCYFDTERYCFKHFYTKCRMQAYVCHLERDLILYENRFCDLVQFLCNEDISDYQWPPEHFEQQIAAMYKKKSNQQQLHTQQQQQKQQQQQQQNYIIYNSTSYSLPSIMNLTINEVK